MFTKGIYITENIWENFQIKKKTQHVTNDISESHYKAMHTIWSLQIHHTFPK